VTGTRIRIAAGIALLVGLVHARVLECGFISYDDEMFIYENPYVRAGLTPDSIRWAFTAHLVSDASPYLDYWQPVTVLSRLLDVEMFGLDPVGHHAVSLLLHALNAALLFLVLQDVTGATWRSAFAAALWGVHPLRVESVAWISDRKDLLAGLFWILGLAAYLRYTRLPSWPRYAAFLGLFVLGMMSKPVLMTLAFALLLLDAWPLGRLQGREWRRQLPRLVAEKIPLVLLSAGSIALTVLSQMRTLSLVSLRSHPLSTRVAYALVDYVRYTAKWFWPPPMALPQALPSNPWPPWLVAGAFALLAAASAAALLERRRRPYLLFGWLWFLGTMFPAMGLVQSGYHPLADRFTYIPHVGLALITAWTLGSVAASMPSARPWVRAAAAAVLAAFSIVTIGQIGYWRDSVTLFTHAVAVTSDNFKAHACLGHALAKLGRTAEAIPEYERSIAIKPDWADARNNLGNVLAAQGRLEEAMAQYRQAILHAPDDAQPHNNLGVVLARLGRTAEAKAAYEAALRIQPRFDEALYNLGRLEAAQGRTEAALQHLAAALERSPAMVAAHYARARILVGMGRLADAERHYRAAVQLQPSDPVAHNNLGRLLALQHREGEAMAEYSIALRLEPGQALAHVNAGRLLASQGRLDEAIGHYRQALRSAPGDAEAHLELAQALARAGREAEARAEHEEALRLDPKLDEARSALAAKSGDRH
jgi:Flp pilus assembly protein TadD